MHVHGVCAILATLSAIVRPASTQHYTRQWVMHVPGGAAVADQVAADHGFHNLGEVSRWNFLVLKVWCMIIMWLCTHPLSTSWRTRRFLLMRCVRQGNGNWIKVIRCPDKSFINRYAALILTNSVFLFVKYSIPHSVFLLHYYRLPCLVLVLKWICCYVSYKVKLETGFRSCPLPG